MRLSLTSLIELRVWRVIERGVERVWAGVKPLTQSSKQEITVLISSPTTFVSSTTQVIIVLPINTVSLVLLTIKQQTYVKLSF